MFFSLSKLFWMIAAPLNLLTVITIVGHFMLPVAKRSAKFMLYLSLALFFAGGATPLSAWLLSTLERRYDIPDLSVTPPPTGIIVLGGATDTALSAHYDWPQVSDAADRLLTAIALKNRFPSAKLVFTGGEGRFVKSGVSEGDVTQDLLQKMGIGNLNPIYERHSRNTYENAAMSFEKIQPKTGERWILVTSAYHMPRAHATFDSIGWPGIIPFPTDYKTAERLFSFDVLGNFYKLDLAIKEYVGFVAYMATGKITTDTF